MNIFYLDEDPIVISEMLCDKHNVKMIVESGQMLCTAHRVLDGDEYADENELYKATHKNHPSSVWTRKTDENYYWHFDLFRSMLSEYTFRYGKIHKCEGLLDALVVAPKNINRGGFTPPPQCMPDEYRSDDTVEAYRKYYIGEKASFAKWKFRETPDWFNV